MCIRKSVVGHPGVAVEPLDLSEHSYGGPADMDYLGPGLGIGQAQNPVVEVYVVPFEGLDFCKPAAREHEEADEVDHRLVLATFPLAFAQGLAQTAQLVGAQVALALLLLLPLDVPAWIGAVRAQAPQLSKAEHLHNYSYHPIPGDAWRYP